MNGNIQGKERQICKKKKKKKKCFPILKGSTLRKMNLLLLEANFLFQ